MGFILLYITRIKMTIDFEFRVTEKKGILKGRIE